MISRRLGATVLAAALALGAAACDDNPVDEGRDDATRLFLSHQNAAVAAGGTIVVTANVLNQYGERTGAAVTGQACDNKITVTPDTARSTFEFPERFRVTGASFGTSCIVVSGSGVTDTIHVRVVPLTVQLSERDTLPSGLSHLFTVQFLGATGAPVPGLTLTNANATFTSSNTSILAVDATGNVTAQAPGVAFIKVSSSVLGVTRTDSVQVIVVPGTFTGTVAQANYQGGQVLQFTAGALAFDADTEARFRLPYETWYVLAPTTPTTARTLLPFGLPAGTRIDYDIVNVGAGQVAVAGSFILTQATPAEDSLEPDLSAATPKSMVPGTDFFGSVTATDDEDLIKLTVTEQGSYTVTAHWNDGSDIDLYVLDASLSSVLLRRETLANPETGAVTLAPGTYYIDLFVYEKIGSGPATYRVRVTK